MVAWGTYGDKDLLQGEILVRVAHAGMHMQGTASAGTSIYRRFQGSPWKILNLPLTILKRNLYETFLWNNLLIQKNNRKYTDQIEPSHDNKFAINAWHEILEFMTTSKSLILRSIFLNNPSKTFYPSCSPYRSSMRFLFFFNSPWGRAPKRSRHTTEIRGPYSPPPSQINNTIPVLGACALEYLPISELVSTPQMNYAPNALHPSMQHS